MNQEKPLKFQNCSKHTSKKIKFIQVNKANINPDQNIFYCIDCFNEDLSFQGINYQLLDQIIKEGENNIIQKWPPVNDYQLIDKLIKETSQSNQQQQIIQKIASYFREFKDEIIQKIEACEAKMINLAHKLLYGKNQIIKKYQEISQIQQLRSLIIEIKDKQLNEKSIQQKIRSFIAEVELKKDESTEQLQKLFDSCVQQQYLINYEFPDLIKQQIFSFIDKINFFDDEVLNNKNRISVSQQLMYLISNKSNYCSSQFLNQVQTQLENLNPFFENISTQNMFIQGKQPIDFKQLSDQKMDDISLHVQHIINLQENRNYHKQIEQSQFIKDLEKIIKSKLNFISKISQKSIIEHLIETYPYFKYDQNILVIENQEKFECFNIIDKQMLEDLFLLMQKRQQFINNPNESQSYQMKNSSKFKEYKKDDLDRILDFFPIFDFIPKSEINIKDHLQLIKSTFNDGDKRIQIVKNDQNEYEIGINEDEYIGYKSKSFTNCMSNMILQKDKKYIFRTQLKLNNYNSALFQLGLMQQSNLNKQEGYRDQLFANFKHDNTKIKLNCDRFNNYLKGKDLELPVETLIELRVWLGGQILQISDFPNYDYIVSINNLNLERLKNLENLCFVLQPTVSQQKYILRDVLIVDEFNY